MKYIILLIFAIISFIAGYTTRILLEPAQEKAKYPRTEYECLTLSTDFSKAACLKLYFPNDFDLNKR